MQYLRSDKPLRIHKQYKSSYTICGVEKYVKMHENMRRLVRFKKLYIFILFN